MRTTHEHTATDTTYREFAPYNEGGRRILCVVARCTCGATKITELLVLTGLSDDYKQQVIRALNE